MHKIASRSLLPFLALFAMLFYGCGSGGSSSSITPDGGGDGTGGEGKSFSVGGTVSGLSGKGLTLESGGKTLAVDANGTFTFKTPVPQGTAYDVTVATQPSMPAEQCTVTNGKGTVTADVTNVAVNCTTKKLTIGGTVIGLSGTGLVLQDNGADDLAVSADGTFTFATPVASGDAFSVTVQTQPTGPTQTCTVTGGTGTVGSANVTDVMVNCGTTDFVIGGKISGLGSGSVVLQDNGGDNLTVSANGTFAFATPVASGAAYDVTVLTQPSSPSQTCVVSMGMGTVASANVTSVSIICATNANSVGGTVTGLATGASVVLQDNGGDNLTVSANGSFTFPTPVTSGGMYAVTVLTQPTDPTQTCVVTNDTGTVGGAAVTNVTVTCTTSTYTIGGTLTGLGGSDSVTLEDNGGDDLTVSANGSFTFATPVASGASFNVTVLTQPGAPAQTCTVSGGMGTVVAGNVTSVTVNCTTNTYTIGGTITGLAGTLVVEDNGGDDLSLNMNGTFAFATPLASGLSYAVTVLTQPGTPTQTCTIANTSGTVTNANVTNVAITCTTNTYTVGGTITGLATGDSVVLQDNGADNLTVDADGTFTFATPVASGNTFAVTTLTNPSSPIAQTCVVTNDSGSVTNANITSVTVTCTTNTYTIGGTVSGLSGTGLILQDNGADNLTISANGGFTFATSLASGSAYSVTVLSDPASPSQNCVVTNGSATVGSANVTNVTVTCSTNVYTVGGTLSGLLSGESVVIQDNGANNLTLNANGSFTFATPLASGVAYSVTVLTNPSSPIPQTCLVTAGTGTVTNANITSVTVICGFDAHNITDGTYAYMSQNGAGTIYKVNESTGAVTLLASGEPGAGYTMAFRNGVLYAGSQGSSPTVIYTVNTTTGAFTTFATLPVGGGDWICGLWFDPSGNLYFNADTNSTVYKVTPAGVVSAFITSADGHLAGNNTQGTADSSGNLYIASRNSDAIFKYNSSGVWVSTLTSSCPPWGLALASNGNLLYTCDTTIVYSLNLTTLANSTFATPGGTLAYMSVDGSGDVYVGEWSGDSAYKFSSTGTLLWSTTIGTASSSSF